MTNAEAAILSLVAEKPRHGYEIEQVIEERGMRDWTEVGFSSIYYLLKKLEQDGLIESQLEAAARGPARRVYRATESGRTALVQALREALSVPKRWYPPLQLGLANLPALSRTEVLEALHHYEEALAQRLQEVRTRQKAQEPLPYFVQAQFNHSTTLVRAEMSWVKQFIRRLEEQDG